MFEFLDEPIPITSQQWREGTIPLVSISCITYNHENYIRNAIEGFLMQKTTFPVEILIHDDASTDKTAEIVREYEKKYPQLIKPIYQTENQYSKNNALIGRIQRERAVGKYYATCEGDDYWIDPLKLQKQVDFLEANPDYGLVHTSCQHTVKNKNKINQNPEIVSSGFVFKNLLCHDFYISTLTVCARTKFILEWTKIIEKEMISRDWKMGDYPLWLEGSLHTKFGFIPDITAHYRILDESITHSNDQQKKFEFFQSVFEIKKFFAERENVDDNIRKKINTHYNKILLFYAFKLRNRKDGEIAYSYLKINSKKIQLYEYLLYLGSRYYLWWFTLSFLLKAKRKLYFII